MSELMKQFQNLMGTGGNWGLLARHLNCEKTQLMAFYEGSEDALTLEQKEVLIQMLIDLYSGKNRSGGFYIEDGKLMWSSK
jgi:hypothetical protein